MAYWRPLGTCVQRSHSCERDMSIGFLSEASKTVKHPLGKLGNGYVAAAGGIRKGRRSIRVLADGRRRRQSHQLFLRDARAVVGLGGKGAIHIAKRSEGDCTPADASFSIER